MKETKKITIKQFVTEYSNKVSQLQESYIKENLVITPYVSFVKKDALAQKLVDISTYKYENYTKEDGTIGQKKTDVISVNSTAQYILFCRVVIENYTNLTVETDGFFEEYDLLKQSGLLDKLMVGTEQDAPLISADEIGELRSLLELKQKDILFNQTEVHNYISSQVERFGTLIGVTLKPVLDKIAESIEKMDDKDIEKLGNKIERALKRVK